MRSILFLGICLLVVTVGYAQKSYVPKIETCDCAFKVDTNFTRLIPPEYLSDYVFQLKKEIVPRAECGYLIVPENRKKTDARMIRLPFVILRGAASDKRKDPLLFTSGGPGNSSLGWINHANTASLGELRDCIAFEQRGTRYALPYLRTIELDSVMRIAWRKNLNKDSMWLVGVRLYKNVLLKRGIDLAGYNTSETVDDIGDLMKALQIDSVNLYGGSYSGGLMTAVLQRYPERVRSLILDSPLPTFSPIDEDEHRHFMEGLHVLCELVRKDSTDEKYADLENRFDTYFRSIQHKTFTVAITDPVTKQALQVSYDKNELLDVVVQALNDGSQIPNVAAIIVNIINGVHTSYVQPRIEKRLRGRPHPDGMRMLVYCADASSYHDEAVLQQLFKLYPYMKGYHINDVWKEVCDCWKNPPVPPSLKKYFYSDAPVLVAGGAMDAACSPRYITELKHYLPNAQAFVFSKLSHGVGGRDFNGMIQQFLSAPMKKIEISNVNIIPVLR